MAGDYTKAEKDNLQDVVSIQDVVKCQKIYSMAED